MKKIYLHFFVRVILLGKRVGTMLFPKGNNYEKFMILCSARTGSTWLHTLLNSSLYIHSHGEIVREVQKKNHHPFQEFAFGKHPRFIQAVGLKVFYELPAYREALEYLLNHKEIKVILLTRASSIAQFTSYKKAQRSDHWSYSKSSSESKIKIDLEEFLSYEMDAQKVLSEWKDLLTDHQVFSLTYEGLLADQSTTLYELQRFLGVPPRKLRSVLKKQSNTPLSEQIANWEEIKNQL